jgi:hypothetical protein
MVRTALDEIHTHFDFLLTKRGFALVGAFGPDPKVFGNSWAIIESKDFRLVFVVDRGPCTVYIGPPGRDERFGCLYLAHIIISGGDIMKPPRLKDQAVFLRNNYEKVANLFAPENVTATAEAINQLRIKRTKAYFPGWQPEKTRDWKADVDAIRKILMSEWNPIGCGVPDDQWILAIYTLMRARFSVMELAAHLAKLEARMGLPDRPAVNNRVAQMLLDLMK